MRLGKKPKTGLVLALPGGVRLRLRPATFMDNEAAQAAAFRAMDGLRNGESIAASYGLGDEVGKALDNADVSMGFASLIHLVELALVCVEGWDGVEDAAGAPAAVTRAHLAEFLRDNAVALMVRQALFGPIWEAQSEGEGFAPSSTGGSETARPIAMDAAGLAGPAPGA